MFISFDPIIPHGGSYTKERVRNVKYLCTKDGHYSIIYNNEKNRYNVRIRTFHRLLRSY